MRIITDTKLVTRNAAIAKYTGGAGLVLLVGALLLNLYALSRPQDTQLLAYVFGAFLVGYTLTNLGGAMNNRWGRRADKGLGDALRGLDDRWTLYNFRLGASHALVGPSGVFILHPKYQYGLIAFEGGKWRNPGAPRGFLALFNRDPLGNPSGEAAAEVDALNRFLAKQAPELKVNPQALIVFMHPRAIVEAREAPVPAVYFKNLKEHLRKLPKGPTVPAPSLHALEEKLGIAAPKEQVEAQ